MIAALSSNLSVTPFTALPAPASDITITRVPVGPASITSRSPGNVWLTSTKLTVTLLTTPGNPETVTTDGYGKAGAASVRRIGSILKTSPGSFTLLTTAAVSLPAWKSARSDDTETRFVMRPELDGWTMMAMVLLVETAMSPRAQTTVVLESTQEPLEGRALMKLTPTGSVSRTTTPVVSFGPRFCTDTL